MPEPSVATVFGWVHVLPRLPFRLQPGHILLWSGDPSFVVLTIDDGPRKSYPVSFEYGDG